MDVFEDKSDNFRMWFFVVFQWGCFVLQVCLLKLHSILTIYVGSDGNEIIGLIRFSHMPGCLDGPCAG